MVYYIGNYLLSHIAFTSLLDFRIKQLTTSIVLCTGYDLWHYFHSILGETNSNFWLGVTCLESPPWLRGNLGHTTPVTMVRKLRHEGSVPQCQEELSGVSCNTCSRAVSRVCGNGEQIPCVGLNDNITPLLGVVGLQIIQKLTNLSLGMISLPC